MSDSNIISFPPDIVVKDTGTIKGRGVYAARSFQKDEIVEASPVIILHRPYEQLPPRIQEVVYNWGDLTEQAPCTALVLGYGALYNHDNPANMRYEACTKSDTLKYIAVRAIEEGEELTVNYNSGLGSHTSESDDWFDKRNIKPMEDDS